MSAAKKAKKIKKRDPKSNSDYGSTRIERGIYRVNYPSHKGIRAYLKFKDTEYQKVFSVKTGDEKEALAQAIQWRKERLEEIQQLPEASNPFRKRQSNNTSGVVGVRRGLTAWSAVWVENGKQRHRSFAVGKFGEEEALKLACEARADAEKRIYGQVFQAQPAVKTLPNSIQTEL